MVAVISTEEFLATVSVLSGVLSSHLPPSFSDLSLQIVCPDFEGALTLPIIDANSEMESGRVVFRTAVDFDSTVVLTFNGELSRVDDKFEIQRVDLDIETTTKLASSDFVLASLRAMLSLSTHVYLQIPEVELDLDLSFDAPLLDISKMLKRRQMAFRIMVIESATGHEFELPPGITDEQAADIALIYHAIVDREFDWPLNSVGYGFPATNEVLDRITSLNKLSSAKFGPHSIDMSLFGKDISLGEGMVTIENKFIENFEEVQHELARNDGHLVAVEIRSLSGKGRYELPAAPRLPRNPWASRIQTLINLDTQLDSKLVTRYHALAASTLEGLSEREKSEMTRRTEIGDAFLIDESDTEIN